MKLSVIVSLFAIGLNAQTFNQFDESGKRDGVWRKYFEGTKVLRYEGAFKNGKEIGLFKFYKNIKGKPVLTATRQFNDSTDIAEVVFYASNGKVISEGKMKGKTYVGTWKYYQKASKALLTLETYNDQGKLNGERFVYFDNGQIAEKTFYKDGQLQGKAEYYSLKGTLLKSFLYLDNQLHGEAKFYNPKGELIVSGKYNTGKKDSIWSYYNTGKLDSTVNFSTVKKYVPIKKAP